MVWLFVPLTDLCIAALLDSEVVPQHVILEAKSTALLLRVLARHSCECIFEAFSTWKLRSCRSGSKFCADACEKSHAATGTQGDSRIRQQYGQLFVYFAVPVLAHILSHSVAAYMLI